MNVRIPDTHRIGNRPPGQGFDGPLIYTLETKQRFQTTVLMTTFRSLRDGLGCLNCIVDDDPRTWCDCSATHDDHVCVMGSCSQLAHDVAHCPILIGAHVYKADPHGNRWCIASAREPLGQDISTCEQYSTAPIHHPLYIHCLQGNVTLAGAQAVAREGAQEGVTIREPGLTIKEPGVTIKQDERPVLGMTLGGEDPWRYVRGLVDRWEQEADERGPGDMLHTSGVVAMLRAAIRHADSVTQLEDGSRTS